MESEFAVNLKESGFSIVEGLVDGRIVEILLSAISRMEAGASRLRSLGAGR